MLPAKFRGFSGFQNPNSRRFAQAFSPLHLALAKAFRAMSRLPNPICEKRNPCKKGISGFSAFYKKSQILIMLQQYRQRIPRYEFPIAFFMGIQKSLFLVELNTEKA